LFESRKWLDLMETQYNNTTNAFQRRGIYPNDLNCESWSSTVDTLGLGNDDKGKVQYEIYPTLPRKELSIEEKKILHKDLNIDLENDITGDVGVAFTCAEQVLKKWCEDIDQAVSEGNEYEQ